MCEVADDGDDSWKQDALRMQMEDPEITVREIAERLGKPFKTVKNYFSNAKKKENKQRTQAGDDTHAAKTSDSDGGPSFKVASIEGKGMGLVALRNIKRGELVISEKPALLVPGSTVGFASLLNGSAKARAEKMLQTQFDQLDKGNQDQVMQLYDKDADAAGTDKTLLGIFESNGLPQGVGSSDGLLCVTISRANHSCVSNCNHSWVNGEERLYAESDIAAAEEICTNYSQWHDTTAERQRALKSKFNFNCTCPACTEDAPSREKHDSIRKKIGMLDERIPDVGATNPAKAVGMVEEVLTLYEQLGQPIPHSAGARHYYDMFQLSLSGQNRNLATAKRWIRKAYEAKIVTDGPKAADTLRFKRFMENPMSRLKE